MPSLTAAGQLGNTCNALFKFAKQRKKGGVKMCSAYRRTVTIQVAKCNNSIGFI